jgi:hypothetical protein
MLNDKDALARSHAGIRLIALATFYNKGDFTRIRAYMREHFLPAVLDAEPIALRIANLREQHRTQGKVRVKQVIAYDKHHVVVLLATEQGGAILEDLTVEEDYPHKISAHTRQLVV